MGQLTPRRQDDESADRSVGSGQRLWLETCTQCKQPLTIVALTRPTDPLCARCASEAAAID